MKDQLKKYERKLVLQGLCEEGSPLIGGLDADVIWNREGDEVTVLEEVISRMHINSILFAKPAEPYFSILNALAQHAAADGAVRPQDTESRTFLHDIPVIPEFSAPSIAGALGHRKSVIIPGKGIVAFGIVSPEQAFITCSSVCFSMYVKLSVDYLAPGGERHAAYGDIVSRYFHDYGDFLANYHPRPALRAPFGAADETMAAMCEAGRLTVSSRMVDSFFGNISYRTGGTIFISQTGSSLDEMEGLIDACPMDNSSTAGITASSELKAHLGVYRNSEKRAILHGHPKFSVIISMLCDEPDCADRGFCHVRCKKKRAIEDVPIVPGEVGTGPTGLSNTLPPALSGRGAIVYGHGLFTTGREDFTDAFRSLLDIEMMCCSEYGKRAGLA